MISADVITDHYKKKAIPQIKSGDTVRVHQRIREGSKQRVQVFEGVVIRTDRMNELTARMVVRRIASGVGVEKSFLLHSPNVSRVDITRRAKVRRNYLSYLRARRGKSARLLEADFDRAAVNANAEEQADAEITELDAEQVSDEEPEVAVSTDELAAAENKEAAAADSKKDRDAADDESRLEAEEVQSGVDAAEAQE